MQQAGQGAANFAGQVGDAADPIITDASAMAGDLGDDLGTFASGAGGFLMSLID